MDFKKWFSPSKGRLLQNILEDFYSTLNLNISTGVDYSNVYFMPLVCFVAYFQRPFLFVHLISIVFTIFHHMLVLALESHGSGADVLNQTDTL